MKRFEFIDFVAVALIQRRRTFIFSRVRDFANVMEALQSSSSTVKSFEDMETLIQSSLKICIEWIGWLIDRGTGNKKRKQGGAGGGGQGGIGELAGSSAGKWQHLLMSNRGN